MRGERHSAAHYADGRAGIRGAAVRRVGPRRPGPVRLDRRTTRRRQPLGGGSAAGTGQPDGGLRRQRHHPEQFRTCLDPFIALAVAATVTTTARLGSSVFVAPWYPPVQLARQLTSIDVISRGRLMPGSVSAGRPRNTRPPVPRYPPRRTARRAAGRARRAVDDQSGTAPRCAVVDSGILGGPQAGTAPHPPIYLGAFTRPGSSGSVSAPTAGWLPCRYRAACVSTC